MSEDELDYLVEKYKVKVFNLHSNEDSIKRFRNSKYKDAIYAENMEEINDDFFRSLEIFSGICLDISHWEDFGLIQKEHSYEGFEKLLETNKVGCSHVSAITKKIRVYKNYRTKKDMKQYSRHFLHDLSELDYIKKIADYLPNLVSIELENSFEEQVKVKKYLDAIINQS